MERALAVLDKDLAARVALVEGLDVHLVRIDAAQGLDEYHTLHGLEDSEGEEGKAAFWFFQRWGPTGGPGSKKLDGPMSERKMRELISQVFELKTGAAWGSLKPGDRVPDGRFWWRQAERRGGAEPGEEEAPGVWEYYVGDGVDGKKKGWYPYEEEASAEVEDIYSQHVNNEKESRTKIRTVSSGYFSYRIDLDAMTQQNSKTGKVRQIRRRLGDAPADEEELEEEDEEEVVKAPKKLRGAKKPRAKKATAKRAPAEKAALKPKKVKKTAMKAKPAKLKKAPKVATGKDAKLLVFQGKFKRTSTGLRKRDLKLNKHGKVVTKKQSDAGKKLFPKLATWIAACQKARAELGITGFAPIKKDTDLYKRAKELQADVKPWVKTAKGKGLKKKGLKINKYGKVVGKKRSEAGKKLFPKLATWIAACQKARAELGITGFAPITKDTELYKKAKELQPHVTPWVLGKAKAKK